MALSDDLIVRPYNEIVDDVLVAMLGGVVNEPLVFDVRETSYPLAEPAREVRGITGVYEESHTTFQPNVDWAFDRAQNAVVWLDNGKRPDPHYPTFYADYFRQSGGDSPLTDINVGSVNRTLTEAISRELAVLYQQVNLAYQSGFIDLARGTALDFVVAILGIIRKTGDYAQGLVTCFRAKTARGNITVPQGVKLTTDKGAVFETVSERTIQRGQVRIDVPVRASEAFKGPAGRVDAHTINNLIIPIEGIERVTNFDPTVLGGADESDDDLRTRAKARLRGLGQCTIDALQVAAREAGATNVEIADPLFPPDDETRHTEPGRVAMIVEVEPERFANVVSLVNERRAAGVHVLVTARYVFIEPRLQIKVRRTLTPDGQAQLKQEIIQAASAFVVAVGSGNTVAGAGLLEAITKVQDVAAAVVVDLFVWETTVAPGAQLGQRQAARARILKPDGAAAASDTDIEAGLFQVKIDAQTWPVLEMEPADIQLTGP